LIESDFRKQLKKSGYLINPKEPSDFFYFNGRRERAWVIDYEKLKTVCDVEGFWTNTPDSVSAQ
jgi:hypothetical protein